MQSDNKTTLPTPKQMEIAAHRLLEIFYLDESSTEDGAAALAVSNWLRRLSQKDVANNGQP